MIQQNLARAKGLGNLQQSPAWMCLEWFLSSASHLILGFPTQNIQVYVKRSTIYRSTNGFIVVLYCTPWNSNSIEHRALTNITNQPWVLQMKSVPHSLDNATVTLSFTRTSLQKSLKLDWLDVRSKSRSAFMCGVLSWPMIWWCIQKMASNLCFASAVKTLRGPQHEKLYSIQ